jgi:hypothetical protein
MTASASNIPLLQSHSAKRTCAGFNTRGRGSVFDCAVDWFSECVTGKKSIEKPKEVLGGNQSGLEINVAQDDWEWMADTASAKARCVRHPSSATQIINLSGKADWPPDSAVGAVSGGHGNQMRSTMTEIDKGKTVTLEELVVSTLAMVDAVTKLLIEKGVISEAEFKEKLLKERATYRTLLHNAKPH